MNSTLQQVLSDNDYWGPSLKNFWKANHKYSRALNSYENKPQNYSKLQRGIRIGGSLVAYFGVAALKVELFPLTSSGPSLGFQLFGLLQVATPFVGVKFAYLDKNRKNKLTKRKDKLARKENLLNAGFPGRTAESFLTSLLELKEKDFGKLENKKLSKRDKNKITQHYLDVEKTLAWFARGYYCGEINRNFLDDFNQKLRKIEAKCNQHGIDLGSAAFSVIKSMSKIRQDQDGTSEIIDVDLAESEPGRPTSPFPNRPIGTSRASRAIEATATEKPSPETPGRSIQK
ncbi:MAG: hypothetical protein U0R17_06670 [Acidimicrobiia bacterium]